MRFKIEHTKDCLVLKWDDGTQRSIYALDEEITRLAEHGRGTIRDIGRLMLIEPGTVCIYYPDGNWNAETGRMGADCWRWHVDTFKLIKALVQIRTKRVTGTLDLRRFVGRGRDFPVLTLAQMVRHPNARSTPGEMAKSLLHYLRRLEAHLRPRFIETMSRLMASARMHAYYRPGREPGQEDAEFYFDGRYAGGMGFNGGVILHGREFGVHT